MTASDKLKLKFQNDFHICVGLDSDINKIPKFLLDFDDPVYEFNKRIIESTSEITAAYKLNFAFYEKLGTKGFESLEKTLDLIPGNVLSIADAKRGDIGNTAKYYASAVFESMNFDSVTVNPYMGFDSIEPFKNFNDKLIFILVLTSNKSAVDFEKLILEDGKYVYQSVLGKVNKWNENRNLGIVFGATQKEELAENIEDFNNLITLLPGVGSQGGSLEDITELFSKKNNQNFLVNSSRAVIYADSSEKFNESSRNAVQNYNEIVSKIKSIKL